MIQIKKKKISLLLSTTLAVTSGLSIQAHAQDSASAIELEEVIVTAQKRQESLQDVPVAVLALSGDQLKSSGVSSISTLELVSPSITINDSTGYGLLSVRGVGSTNQGNGNYNSVAIYVDDVYISRLTSSFFGFDSVEQLQVLRGPQGALYGRNATGGAVVIKTRTPEPGQDFEGRVSATVGDFDNRAFSVSLLSGFGDKWAGSIELTDHQRDGYFETTTSGVEDVNSRDTFSALAKLKYTPADNVSFVLSAWYDESDDTNAHGYQQVNPTLIDGANPLNQLFGAFGLPQLSNPQLLAFSAAAGGACFVSNGFVPCDGATLGGFLANPANAPTVSALNGGASIITFDSQPGSPPQNNISGLTGRAGSFTQTDDTRISLNASVNFETFDFTSITSVTESNYDAATDILAATPGSVPFGGDNLGFTGRFESETLSQEFRLVSTASTIEWLAGLYYFHDEGSTILQADIFGNSLGQADNEFEVDSVAAYGQLKFPITEAVNLTVGARYTDETYELNDRVVDGDPVNAPGLVNLQTANAIPGFPGAPFVTEQDFSQATGSLILDWKLDNVLLYGSVNTGFKSGNLNSNNPLSGGVDEEEITSYELGFKSNLYSDRVRLNGSLFKYDYDNIHVQVINANSGTTILLNGSNASIEGAELELVALASENLKLNAAATFLDSEYKDDVVVPGGGGLLSISGNNVAGAPEFSATLGLEYGVDINNGRLTFGANALLSGGYFFEVENRVGSGGNDDDGYTVVNANVLYATGNWDFTLWANNLTDEEYYSGGVVANGLSEVATLAPPSNFGVTIGYKY